jgi:uncharacterized protein (TIGR03000 family)
MRTFKSCTCVGLAAFACILACANPSEAGRGGGGGGGHGGGYRGGNYGRGYYGRGYYGGGFYGGYIGIYGWPYDYGIYPPNYGPGYYGPAYPAPPVIAGPQIFPAPTAVAPTPAKATVLITAPEGAEVWLGTVKTTKKGPEYKFRTKPLDPSLSYKYTVRARWTAQDGTRIDRADTVVVRAGKKTVVKFEQ